MELGNTESVVAIIGAITALLTSVLASYAQARKTRDEFRVQHILLKNQFNQVQAELKHLQKERSELFASLEGQTRALQEQSERLLIATNELANMTLQRELLAQKVQMLTEENAMLRREIEVLHRRLSESGESTPIEVSVHN